MTAPEKAKKELGQEMEDGTFYLGRFKGKDGKEKDYFAAAEDAQDKKGKRLSLKFNKAAKYAKNAKVHGHDDWMVPTGWDDRNDEPDILNAIFNNKAKIPGLDLTGSHPAGWYWSSTSNYDYYAHCQCLGDGDKYDGLRRSGLSVRLVRSAAIFQSGGL